MKYECRYHGEIDSQETMSLAFHPKEGKTITSSKKCYRCIVDFFDSMLPELLEIQEKDLTND